MSGHVTPVPNRRLSVSRAIAPITLQTNALCPCLSIHGWKWSEISAKLKPASSAARAFSTSAPGSCSSLEMAYPSSTIGPYLPGEDRP